ncbi:carboxymuconolactone decarboxylase family protein [Streptomyces cinereospinus]
MYDFQHRLVDDRTGRRPFTRRRNDVTADTAAAAPGNRIYIDKQHPDAYRALVATADTVKDASGGGRTRPRPRRTGQPARLAAQRLRLLPQPAHPRRPAGRRDRPAAGRPGGLARHRGVHPRERAALALAEATTHPADAAAQTAAYAEARAALSDDEISAVIWVALTMNAFNRVSVMSKHPVRKSAAVPAQ